MRQESRQPAGKFGVSRNLVNPDLLVVNENSPKRPPKSHVGARCTEKN
jgi:hypothetical protein